MITARAFAGKHYAVYGLARSGLATVEALLASGARVTAWDGKAEARAKAPAGAALADLDEVDLSQFDSLVVTPGLPLNRHPIARRAREAGVEIIGDIELFARARPELPPHKVVGITGTNGKSTTTALVHHILKTTGVPTMMGGNIGLPILSQDPLPEGGVYVLELSSFQIDLTRSLDCDVAVLLNITPDHLDRYDCFEAYAASKARLFEMQSEHHTAVATAADWWGRKIYDVAGSGFLDVSDDVCHVWQGEPGALAIYEQANWPSLQGTHNLSNVEAAMSTCFQLGLDGHKIREGLQTFPGLPHRMERIREKDGVLFVNDSKATNVEAAAPALAAYPKVRWIVGGQAKAETLGDTAQHLGHVIRAYTIGEAGPMFERLLREAKVDVISCETLENAVKRAAEDSQSGDTVLLSPASASFDQFRDFEARGDRFRELVEGL
ncbi:UDP-N-acetylmuramoyl-L-alanine--D-glutamate ligase [Sphingomonas sp. HDW15A]|uniref:UDP-N-acetylmuramoyl-L-alanine--D-glutamate ligase n=1 Tax=Sphingomonas sp. HDW15A TaxID=2714942 RepID=UPI0014081704|nr:UDP-N-acetylmuramoyl-L-alanine--D-glutamate ligase [Sphingomonas sp. HDW15A]QIK96595.1 UDP-N-acetylmuramoyl-L-alanine--D-glutamate ligase [Sphingomonas sp. HDW15A]